MEQEFNESDKSLKHELESIQNSCLSHVSGSNPFTGMITFLSANSV